MRNILFVIFIAMSSIAKSQITINLDGRYLKITDTAGLDRSSTNELQNISSSKNGNYVTLTLTNGNSTTFHEMVDTLNGQPAAYYWSKGGNSATPVDYIGTSNNTSLRLGTNGNAKIIIDSSASMLQFGGTTSSFPALIRNSTTIEVRTSDRSSYANLTGNILNAQNRIEATVLQNPTSGNIAQINPSNSGPVISHNIADANAALRLQQLSASSTGNILQLENSTGIVAAFKQSGKVGTYPGASSNGQTLIWNASTGTFDASTLTAGNGVNISNGAASITIASQLNTTTITASGDGLSTAINVTLPASATWAMVGAGNAAAAGINYWTVSGTTLTINYTIAPASGTNNLSYWIQYK